MNSSERIRHGRPAREGALSIAVDAVATVLLAEVLVRDYEEGEDTLLGLQYY